MKTVYSEVPALTAAVGSMKPVQKAARAAARRGAAVAAMWLLRWKEERQVWAHLVGRVGV